MSIFSKLFGRKDKDSESQPSEILHSVTEPEEIEVTSAGEGDYIKDPSMNSSTAEAMINMSEQEKQDDVKNSNCEGYPTQLHSALRYIRINLRADLTEAQKVMSILNDFQVLNDDAKSKYVLRYILTNNLLTTLNLQDNWGLTSSALAHKIIEETGLQTGIVKYVVECIGYGLSLTDKIPELRFISDSEVTESVEPKNNDSLTKASISDQSKIYSQPTIWDSKDNPFLTAISHLKSHLVKDEFLTIPLWSGKDFEDFVISPGDNMLITGGFQTGKSTLIHQIIASLLYSHHPSDIQFVLMDEYGMELNTYACLKNQFLATGIYEENVIVDNRLSCIEVLSDLLYEANQRLRIIKSAGVFDWFSYTEMFRQGKISNSAENRDLPYIIVVIDEITSFLNSSGSDIEFKLSRLSQLSSKVGVSIIASTNQVIGEYLTPSFRNIFTTKILFNNQNSSSGRLFGIPYKTISSLGIGEFLISNFKGLKSYTTSLIDQRDLNDLLNHINAQGISCLPYYLANHIDGKWIGKDERKYFTFVKVASMDNLSYEVAEKIIKYQQPSTSFIQRNFSIGYARAGQIMDQLESIGVVGPYQANKPRLIMMGLDELKKIFNK